MTDTERTSPGFSPDRQPRPKDDDFVQYLSVLLIPRVRMAATGLSIGYFASIWMVPSQWILLSVLGGVSVIPALLPKNVVRRWAESFAMLIGQLTAFGVVWFPEQPMLIVALLLCMLHALIFPLRPSRTALSLIAQGSIIAAVGLRSPIHLPLFVAALTLAARVARLQLSHWRAIWEDRATLRRLRERVQQESREQEAILRTREAELLEQQERMVRQGQWATLGRVAAGVGHEIKNPLQAAMADLETARRTQDLAVIEDAQGSLMRIRDLLTDLSQLRGKDREDVDNYGLREVTRASVRGALMGIKGLRVTVGDMPDVAVRLNQARMTQVLANLLTNAWHAVERRGHGEVRIHAALSAQRVFLYVDDDGPGVPAAAWERVFEAFVTTKSAGRGTGLGLPVSRGLMRAMGGDLWLDEGSVLHGARMVMAIAYAPSGEPRQQVRTQVSVSSSEAPTLRTHTQTLTPPHAPTQPRREGVLLIVDDDPRVRRSLQRMAGESWTVLAAENSVRARELASNHPIDVVLCDLHLVREDAVDVLDVLRGVRPDLVQRTVLMSGEPTSARLLALAEANPERLLGKPFNRKAALTLLAAARRDKLPFLEVPDAVDTPASVAAIEPAWRFDPPTEETVVMRRHRRHAPPRLASVELPGES
ncbi:MAG: ATP-binding protein [Myxococcota bacterium]